MLHAPKAIRPSAGLDRLASEASAIALTALTILTPLEAGAMTAVRRSLETDEGVTTSEFTGVRPEFDALAAVIADTPAPSESSSSGAAIAKPPAPALHYSRVNVTYGIFFNRVAWNIGLLDLATLHIGSDEFLALALNTSKAGYDSLRLGIPVSLTEFPGGTKLRIGSAGGAGVSADIPTGSRLSAKVVSSDPEKGRLAQLHLNFSKSAGREWHERNIIFFIRGDAPFESDVQVVVTAKGRKADGDKYEFKQGPITLAHEEIKLLTASNELAFK